MMLSTSSDEQDGHFLSWHLGLLGRKLLWGEEMTGYTGEDPQISAGSLLLTLWWEGKETFTGFPEKGERSILYSPPLMCWPGALGCAHTSHRGERLLAARPLIAIPSDCLSLGPCHWGQTGSSMGGNRAQYPQEQAYYRALASLCFLFTLPTYTSPQLCTTTHPHWLTKCKWTLRSIRFNFRDGVRNKQGNSVCAYPWEKFKSLPPPLQASSLGKERRDRDDFKPP